MYSRATARSRARPSNTARRHPSSGCTHCRPVAVRQRKMKEGDAPATKRRASHSGVQRACSSRNLFCTRAGAGSASFLRGAHARPKAAALAPPLDARANVLLIGAPAGKNLVAPSPLSSPLRALSCVGRRADQTGSRALLIDFSNHFSFFCRGTLEPFSRLVLDDIWGWPGGKLEDCCLQWWCLRWRAMPKRREVMRQASLGGVKMRSPRSSSSSGRAS